ncbi:MAG: 3-phosphoglycerate dehydrogenase [Calditrichaceae bacterium]|nr:3-phosphoglycerate dehydrogenase [Calditrichaceae bacterium]MBN2710611.1 3-phosphoglycerate dehydrogenase [Calditrichaceae bacterium]RQV96791.1 MAG: 3-phosphoglycerate dehydrogenase [Calditrichota bacterium]
MKKVLVATEKPFAAVAVNEIKKIIADAGYEFALLEKYTDAADLKKAVAKADALIIRSDIAGKEVIEAGKNLKIVVRAGAGYDNIDLAACTAKGVVAMNTPGQNSNAVAELALGMMVYIARGMFNGKAGTELRGKTLGIHAYGNVGWYVGEIAKGFGMKISAFDPFIPDEAISRNGIAVIKSLEELYTNNQYVSLNIPANEQTKKSIGYKLLSLMPKGATLVNTARKEIIDEPGLLEMFAKREDFKYVSDIAPDCAADIAAKYEGRFYFTPKKMGAQTAEANINAGIAAARQIVNFFEKGDRTFQVNK